MALPAEMRELEDRVAQILKGQGKICWRIHWIDLLEDPGFVLYERDSTHTTPMTAWLWARDDGQYHVCTESGFPVDPTVIPEFVLARQEPL